MKKEFTVITLLIIVAGLASAQLPATRTRKPEPRLGKAAVIVAAPDLQIREYLFPPPDSNTEVKAYRVAKNNSSQGLSRTPAQFALVAASFKNSGGNYNLANNGKVVLVLVMNSGKEASGACRLMLTIQKIGGAAVGRKTVATVPALNAGKDVWVAIDANIILPNSVLLESTSFTLKADPTEIVSELNENNNEALHNP